MADAKNQLMLRKKEVNSMTATLIQQSLTVLAARQIDGQAFQETMLNAFMRKPKILQASNQSLAIAIRSCIADGLIPDGTDAYIDNWSGTAVYLPMVTGIKRLFHEATGAFMKSGVVRQADDFEIIRTEQGERVHHRRALNAVESPIIAWYSEIKLPDEPEFRILVMDLGDIERAKGASKSKEKEIWNKYPDWMGEKTVVKRHVKTLLYMVPKNAAIAGVMEREDREYDEEVDGNIIDVEPEVKTDVKDPEPKQEAQPEPEKEAEPEKKTGKRTTKKSTKKAAPKEEAKAEPEAQAEPEPEGQPVDTSEASFTPNAEEQAEMDEFLGGDDDDDPTEL